MKLLSQRDPSWAADKLGASSLTVGRFGCTTVCLSMLSDYFKCSKSPLEIAHNAANYTPGGLVLWWNLRFDHMAFVSREHTINNPKVEQYMRDPNLAVLLNVNGGAHWVVGIRKTIFGNDWLVADPWTGKKCLAKSIYHDVVGAAYFKRI